MVLSLCSVAAKEILSAFISDKDRVALGNRRQLEAKNSLEPANRLTQREQEILLLLAARKTHQKIALALYITLGTVRVHVHHTLQKLQVIDLSQAIVVALQKQLIRNDLIL